MREVSDKQSEIYEFLKTFTDNKGYPPSVREICEAVGLRSTSSVHGHLKRLESKGLIKRDPTKPRALEIIDNSVKRDGFPYRDSIFAQIDIPVPFRLYIPAVSEESSSAEPTVRVFFL